MATGYQLDSGATTDELAVNGTLTLGTNSNTLALANTGSLTQASYTLATATPSTAPSPR